MYEGVLPTVYEGVLPTATVYEGVLPPAIVYELVLLTIYEELCELVNKL